jgi:hypothetical protein
MQKDCNDFAAAAAGDVRRDRGLYAKFLLATVVHLDG